MQIRITIEMKKQTEVKWDPTDDFMSDIDDAVEKFMEGCGLPYNAYNYAEYVTIEALDKNGQVIEWPKDAGVK